MLLKKIKLKKLIQIKTKKNDKITCKIAYFATYFEFSS